MSFLFHLPLWLLGIALNVWLMGTAVVGLWAARRWILPRLKLSYSDAYIAAAVVQSVMVLYGLVAALTAVAVWQRNAEVGDIVSAEATAITSLWRDLGAYPEPLRTATRVTLRGYTEQIIRQAWPEQRQGQIPSKGVEWMDRLQQQFSAFEPVTESQKIAHAETWRAFNQLVQQRRQRLDAVNSGLPWVLWWVLLPGAMGCVLLFVCFHVDNPWFHTGMLFAIAGFIAMVLFVIISLDRPLQGTLAVSSESYELIYEHHMK